MVHQDQVVGKLVGFDRLIFKGHLTRFYPPGGMKAFLDRQGVLLKDFGTWAKGLSEAVKAHAQAAAAQAGRPYVYLAETHTKSRGNSKEDLARKIMARDRVLAGLICVLAAVEPCSSFDIFRNKQAKRLEIIRRRRKCLHYYWYYLHPELGFCHVRLQGWLPFQVQVWVNGREALSTSLTAKGVGHARYANAICSVANWGLAQRLAERWALQALGTPARRPGPPGKPASWDASAGRLRAVLVGDRPGRGGNRRRLRLPPSPRRAPAHPLRARRLGLLSPRRAALLGAKAHPPARGRGDQLRPAPPRRMASQAHHDPKLGSTCYDKANVLRVEVTINDPTQFRVLRNKNGHRVWCPMRKGVANLHRYFEIGRAANERYLQALAAATDNTDAIRVLDRHCRPMRNRPTPPIPRHPLRPANHVRRHRHPRPALPRRLPANRRLSLLYTSNILADRANPAEE